VNPAEPGEPVEVEFIDSIPLPAAHVEVEANGGLVMMTVEHVESDVDITLIMSPNEARQLGDLLFRVGCAESR
jgi:hypothetical protein